MLVCNIGHGNIETVNLITKGHDYGWPMREGTFAVDPNGDLNKVYPLPLDDSAYGITYPVAQFDHDEGKAISGGLIYTGSTITALKEKYIFGDINSGRLFYIDVNDIAQGRQAPVKEWKISVRGNLKTLADLCGSKRVDLHFGRDAQGELYIMTKADGKVYRIVSAANG
jgi:glucose/arabinose dehydrogenase